MIPLGISLSPHKYKNDGKKKPSHSIKEVVREYMRGCKTEARKIGLESNIYDNVPYYRVLTHKGQLQAMIKYVYANAERAWQHRRNIYNPIPVSFLRYRFVVFKEIGRMICGRGSK